MATFKSYEAAGNSTTCEKLAITAKSNSTYHTSTNALAVIANFPRAWNVLSMRYLVQSEPEYYDNRRVFLCIFKMISFLLNEFSFVSGGG